MISMLSSANARPKTIGDVRAVIRPHGQREDESARLFRPRGGLEARATEDMFFGAPHTRPGRPLSIADALAFLRPLPPLPCYLPVTRTRIVLDKRGGFSRLQRLGPWPNLRGTGLLY